MVKCVLSNNLYIMMEVLTISSLIGIGIPVIASRADTDDTALAVVCRIFPSHNCSIAADTKNLAACACFPCIMIIVAAPVGADMILSCRVCDVIARISAIHFIWIVALNEVPDADAEETLNAVRRAVDTFVGDAAQFDDLTMMCIVYHGAEHAQVPEIKGERGNEA